MKFVNKKKMEFKTECPSLRRKWPTLWNTCVFVSKPSSSLLCSVALSNVETKSWYTDSPPRRFCLYLSWMIFSIPHFLTIPETLLYVSQNNHLIFVLIINWLYSFNNFINVVVCLQTITQWAYWWRLMLNWIHIWLCHKINYKFDQIYS